MKETVPSEQAVTRREYSLPPRVQEALGALVGERLMSLIRTCRQRGLAPLAQMVALQRASGPLVLSLTPAPP